MLGRTGTSGSGVGRRLLAGAWRRLVLVRTALRVVVEQPGVRRGEQQRVLAIDPGPGLHRTADRLGVAGHGGFGLGGERVQLVQPAVQRAQLDLVQPGELVQLGTQRLDGHLRVEQGRLGHHDGVFQTLEQRLTHCLGSLHGWSSQIYSGHCGREGTGATRGDGSVFGRTVVRRMIDLNADLGEGFGRWRLGDDDALLELVTSANVACGFHAGDPSTMRRVCSAAVSRGVRVGAQVGYRDLAGFGRRDIEYDPHELADDVLFQIGALDAFARAAGDRVRYVKPHGALYNRIVHDAVQAEAVVRAVRRFRVGTRRLAPCTGPPRIRIPGTGYRGRPADSSRRLSPIAPTRPQGRWSRAPRPAPC